MTGLKYIRSAVFNPEGSLLYIGGIQPNTVDRRESPLACLSVWDTTTCTEVKRILLGSNLGEKEGEGDHMHLGFVVLSPDGKWLAAAVENDIKLLDTGTWRGKAILRNEGWVLSLVFSPDGKRLLAGGTKSVRLWDLESEEKASTFKALTFKRGGINASHLDTRVAFSGDSKRIAFDAYDGKGEFGKGIYFEVWDVEGAKAELLYKRQDETVVCFHPLDNNLLFGSSKLWDLKAGKGLPLDPDQPELKPVRVACASKANVKAIYHHEVDNSRGKVWLPGEKTPRSFPRWYQNSDVQISVSPGGNKLVYFLGGKVNLWDLEILAKPKGEKR